MVLSVRSVRATFFAPTASSSAFAHGLRVASVFAASARQRPDCLDPQLDSRVAQQVHQQGHALLGPQHTDGPHRVEAIRQRLRRIRCGGECTLHRRRVAEVHRELSGQLVYFGILTVAERALQLGPAGWRVHDSPLEGSRQPCQCLSPGRHVIVVKFAQEVHAASQITRPAGGHQSPHHARKDVVGDRAAGDQNALRAVMAGQTLLK